MKQTLKYLSLTIVAFFITFTTYAQTYNWVKGGGTPTTIPSGGKKEAVRHMCSDANGNIYALSVTGNIGPLVADTFYKASGAYGSDQNIFLSSYDCDGVMRWSKLIGSSGGECLPYGITCDNAGHVYVAGYLTNGTLRIGYDTSITGLVYQNQGLMQFDTNGHFNWVRYVGENTAATMSGALSYGSSVRVDGFNNVHFFCNMKFGVPITPSLTSHWGTYDLKYDVIGNLLSVKKLQFADTTLYCADFALDKQTNKLYAVGYVGSSFTTFGAHQFVIAFDTNRNIIWEDTIRNHLSSSGTGAFFNAVRTDENGYLYLVGGSSGTAIYRTDTAKNAYTSGYVAFVFKTDTAGNLRWMRNFSGNTSVNALYSIALMPNGKVAAPGIIAGKVKSGTDSILSYTGEGYNPYFTIIDTGGYVHELEQIHGSGSTNDAAYAVASDNVGSIYVGGQMESSIWGGSITPYTSTGGNSDFFVMKYGMDCSCTTMPVADYTFTGTHTVTFTYTGTTTPAIDSVRWDFGDGTTSTILNPTHVYSAAGAFSACIGVYTACGNDLYCKTITIPCVGAPVTSFAISGTGLTRNFNFTASTTGITGISWTTSDGGSGSGTPFIHTFSAAGTYTVCVTAVNSCGTTTTCNPITVTCISSPVSSFTVGGSGLTKSFTYTGTTSGLDSVTWTFGDGGVATGLTPTHTYAAAGTYTVCAKVFTNCGTHTWCNPVVVTCVTPPAASFTYTVTSASVAFTYTGTTAGMDSVRWNFDDGGTSALLNPTHTFSTDDTFHVCVTVYTNCGSHTSCLDVIISCTIPVTSAFTDTGSLAHGFFYSGTVAGYDSVVWDFGDGATDTGLIALHSYASYGTYHVCAKVYTECDTNTGCMNVVISPVSVASVIKDAINVFPNPTATLLHINNVSELSMYRIVNVVGIAVQTGPLRKGDNCVSLDWMTPGMYLLEVTNVSGGKSTVHFVRQ